MDCQLRPSRPLDSLEAESRTGLGMDEQSSLTEVLPGFLWIGDAHATRSSVFLPLGSLPRPS